MCSLEKRSGQSLVAIGVTGQRSSHLFYITDPSTKLSFLIDTSIHMYGICSLSLDLGQCSVFLWVFIIAGVRNPILGADFL